jgi:hypothetical protein
MRRHIILVIALAFIAGGLVLWIWWPRDQGALMQLEAASWRIGGCLAVLWLAYPDLRNIPRWLWIALPVLIFVLAKWPRLFLLIIPLLILYALLRPRLSKVE